MKFCIIFACLCVVALANEDAEILKYESEVGHDGFHYAYELDNKVNVAQQGHLEEGGKNDEEGVWIVKGQYEYVSPKGKVVQVKYTADDHGYHPDYHIP